MKAADELVEIGLRHGSDKWSGHFYGEPYATHLADLRETSFKLLEIGVGGYDDPNVGGHSLRPWEKFFLKASIVGLDYYDKSPLEEDRIKIYRGSQADPSAITAIVRDNPDGFEVIIDDGSHRNEHVIASFYMLRQHVRHGGWYIIEDLQTSYWPNHGGRVGDFGSPLTSMGFLKSLIDGLNWQEIHQPTYDPSRFDVEITGIYFHHNIAFIRKGKNTEGSTEVCGNRLAGVS